MTVFVVCPTGRVDVDAVRREYGNISYVSDRFVYADEVDDQIIPDNFITKISHAVAAFRPQDDYLLIGADYLQLTVMAAALAARHGKFRVLRYDKKADGRIPVWVGTMDAARGHGLTPPPRPC